MTDPLLVSVVIPAYNRAEFVSEAVRNVLAQDWRPIEVIVVDDGSTDDTAAVVEQLVKDHPGIVFLARRTNGGPGAARQTGVEFSRGEFVQFLDSDDLLLHGKIRVQVTALLSDPEAGIAYGRTVLEHNGIRRLCPEVWSGRPTRHLFPAVLERRFWDTSNPLYRRAALDRMGPWAPRRQLEDWEYDCRAAALGIPVHFCDIDVNLHRSHAEDRLHSAWVHDDKALQDRLWAFRRVCQHALDGAVDTKCKEFRGFVRSLFMMARIAGARGLIDDAERLYSLVQRLSLERRWQIGSFGVLRALLGWQRAVRLSERLRAIRAR